MIEVRAQLTLFRPRKNRQSTSNSRLNVILKKTEVIRSASLGFPCLYNCAIIGVLAPGTRFQAQAHFQFHCTKVRLNSASLQTMYLGCVCKLSIAYLFYGRVVAKQTVKQTTQPFCLVTRKMLREDNSNAPETHAL